MVGFIGTNRRKTVSIDPHARVFRWTDQRQNFVHDLPHGRPINSTNRNRWSGTHSRLLLSLRPIFYVALVAKIRVRLLHCNISYLVTMRD